MADLKKEQMRIFKAELDTLPIQLVPPDPLEMGANASRRPAPKGMMQISSEPERTVVNRVIDRIKKI
jgi:hypothetical protein